MKEVLITGGGGLLATNWACYARASSNVTLGTHKHAVKVDGVNAINISLESEAEVLNAIKSTGAQLVIHTAGYTNVDECELQPDLANNINCELAANVAAACRQADIKLVHISTDHLFSGLNPYETELSVSSPINAYAISKLNAEKKVIQSNPDALIIRTNFFGWGHPRRNSFSDWIYYSLEKNQQIKLFDDVFFTPILIDTLAAQVTALLNRNASGIFNVVSDERISKYEFGLRLADAFGFPKDLISAGSINNLALPAMRPKDMSLSNAKLKQFLGVQSISIDEQLMQLKSQLEDGRATEIKNAIREI